jgi:hypothetical protein
MYENEQLKFTTLYTSVLQHLSVKHVYFFEPPLIGETDYVSLTFNPYIEDEKLDEFLNTMTALMSQEGWIIMNYFVSIDYAHRSSNSSSRLAVLCDDEKEARVSFVTLVELAWERCYSLNVVANYEINPY